MRSWILICKAVHIYIEGYDQKIILTDGVRMIMSMIQYIPQQEKYLIWIIKDAFGQAAGLEQRGGEYGHSSCSDCR